MRCNRNIYPKTFWNAILLDEFYYVLKGNGDLGLDLDWV